MSDGGRIEGTVLSLGDTLIIEVEHRRGPVNVRLPREEIVHVEVPDREGNRLVEGVLVPVAIAAVVVVALVSVIELPID